MSIIKVKVLPGAGKNEIAGKWLDMVKIKVTAAPEDGKANKACIELLAKKFGIPKSKIQIIKGVAGREKYIRINGFDQQKLKNLIV